MRIHKLFAESYSALDFGELFISDFVGVSFATCKHGFDVGVANLGNFGLEVGQEMLDRVGDFAFKVAVAGLPCPVANDILQIAMRKQALDLEQGADTRFVDHIKTNHALAVGGIGHDFLGGDFWIVGERNFGFFDGATFTHILACVGERANTEAVFEMHKFELLFFGSWQSK